MFVTTDALPGNMSIERVNKSPAIVPRVLAERLWGDRDFFVINVGGSGGIHDRWTSFGDRLRAIGFVPLVAEAQRLQEPSKGSKIRYEAALVTCRDNDGQCPADHGQNPIISTHPDPLRRASAVRARELITGKDGRATFDAGAPALYTERRVVLDDFLQPYKHGIVDFLTIDTGGHDFEALLGAQGLLRDGNALGLSIAVQFHGASHDDANTFANIDRFMRAHGFSLFDIDVRRYSRADLPAPFVSDIPAQTLTGQVVCGEALYFRDLGNPEYEQIWPYVATTERVIKLACLFDLFGLPDCAAELLQRRRDLAGDRCDALLDDLAAPAARRPGAYAEYIRAFESDPQAWYESRWPSTRSARAAAKPEGEAESPIREPQPLERAAEQAIDVGPSNAQTGETDASEIKALRKRVARLKEKISDLQERVRGRDETIQELKSRIATRAGESRSWYASLRRRL